jgi:hypothetical protein
MCFVVFETVKVLVSLLAHVALVRLLLLHALSARIRSLGVWIDDGICAVCIVMQSLVIVTMLEKISIGIGRETYGLTDL